jgi:hypothetical protein
MQKPLARISQLGVFDATFIIGGRRRRLGDYLGRTKVIQRKPIQ